VIGRRGQEILEAIVIEITNRLQWAQATTADIFQAKCAFINVIGILIQIDTGTAGFTQIQVRRCELIDIKLGLEVETLELCRLRRDKRISDINGRLGIGLVAVDDIRSTATDDFIVARPTKQIVGARSAFDDVVERPAEQLVVTETTQYIE